MSTHLIRQDRRRRKVEEERLMLARETHQLLHHVYSDAARQLGHVGVTGRRPGSKPAAGSEPAAGS